jgi:hypothetical protein
LFGDFGFVYLACLNQIIEFRQQFGHRNLSVANAVIQIVGRIEAHALCYLLGHFSALGFVHARSKLFEFGLQKATSYLNVLRTLFSLIPLANLIARLSGLDNVKPVAAWSLG